MQRLIINLKKVPTVTVKGAKGKMVKKTFNTVNYIVSNDAQIADRMYQHRDNIKSHRFSACKV